jgi:2-keto-myo-inositol isomerase
MVRGSRRAGMLNKSRIALNRIVYPHVGIEEFFAITAELGLGTVELRNDLPGGRIIDDLAPDLVRKLAAKYRIQILTINALQKFNLPSNLQKATQELKGLIELARSIGCRAIVLCPNNDKADTRTGEQSLRDTVAALKAFRSLFEGSGILGYVEPLGFPESSLRSVLSASQAIREIGSGSYRMVYDTFHHYLGPDEATDIEGKLDVSLVGLVHASGVEADLGKGEMKDGHRVLVTADDRMGNVEQIARLIARGYAGDVSLEPFSSEVQKLGKKAFIDATRKCIDILTR